MSLYIQSFVFNALQENTYVVFDQESKETAIVDPGCYDTSEKQTVKDFIADNELKIKYLLNTHCHIDHVLGNKWVSQIYGVPLMIAPGEESVLRSVPLYAGLYGFEAYQPLEENILHFTTKSAILLGKYPFQILQVPGHSPAHVAFYQSELNICLSGDVLFRGSIGRTDLPGGNFATLEKSIKTVLYTLPEETTTFPGHGPQTTIGYEKRNNPFVRA